MKRSSFRKKSPKAWKARCDSSEVDTDGGLTHLMISGLHYHFFDPDIKSIGVFLLVIGNKRNI
jgi:hypothetical protein